MIRNKNIKARLVIGVAAVGMLLLSSGCQDDGSSMKEFFPADCDSSVKKTFDAQAAAGAQDDATVYPVAFDGNVLNSLGKAKLDLITQTLPDEGPITIYILPPVAKEVSPEQIKVRSMAVAQYLLNSHLTADQFQLVNGVNPKLNSSSGNALANYSKSDTGTASDQTGSDASTAASANAAAH